MKINLSMIRKIIMLVLLIIILIRPTFSTESSQKSLSNLNIWFVVDATGSMVAKDVDNGNKRRFELVQEDVADIVKRVPGAKYGVIVQDYTSYLVAPMTTSADAIISTKPYLMPKYSYYAQPTELSELLDAAYSSISSYEKTYPERNDVIVFMSDGEDVSERAKIVSTKNLSSLLDGAVVLGYGSTTGSIIEEISPPTSYSDDDGISEDFYVTFYKDNDKVVTDDKHRVISKLDENNLNRIATSVNGKYYHRDGGAVPDNVISDIQKSATEAQADPDSETTTGAEIYWIFAILLLAVLLWDTEEFIVKLLAERETKHD